MFADPSEAYMAVLGEFVDGDTYAVSPRGQLCHELRDYSFTVAKPFDGPILTKDTKRNEVMARYLGKEMKLYRHGKFRAVDFVEASNFWENMANPDGTINSAYGWLIWVNRSCRSKFSDDPLTPWQWARDSLINDRDSRQAFLRFSLPEHQWAGNKDVTCTMHGNFLIRANRLHLTMVMRSNDIVKGLPYDMPFFCSLQEQMRDELSVVYPGLEMGHYTHFAHSMHLYERDMGKACAMLYGR